MTRRRSTTVALAVATLAGGLLLTACGGASSTDSASAAGSSASASTDGAGDAAGTTDGSSNASSAGSSSSGANAASSSDGSSGAKGSGGSGSRITSDAAGAGAAVGSGACRTADLAFSVAPGSGAQSVGSAGGVVIKMTNKGSAACTMTGYPGVDLVGGGVTWSLVRQTSVAPHPVTVRPGSSTSFTITYMPFTKGSGEQVDVKTMVITPPNETHSTQLAWDFQPVLRQDGATHPATFVGPVGGQ